MTPHPSTGAAIVWWMKKASATRPDPPYGAHHYLPIAVRSGGRRQKAKHEQPKAPQKPA